MGRPKRDSGGLGSTHHHAFRLTLAEHEMLKRVLEWENRERIKRGFPTLRESDLLRGLITKRAKECGVDQPPRLPSPPPQKPPLPASPKPGELADEDLDALLKE